jgi:repressor LexA
MGPDYVERIKEIKSERKMTNEALSNLSGIPLGTLSKLLAGISDSVKLSNIVAICDALDCSLDYIVSGIPENTNNFTLEGDEIRLVEEYRRLDSHGKELVMMVAGKERERVSRVEYSPAPAARRESAIITAPITRRYRDSGAYGGKLDIALYDLPVSAGTGEYLDSANAEKISVNRNPVTEGADYALRISGNSMEPKYHNGDILLVETADSVEVGELGIFILDGDGYFKIYGGDCLISLNPDYGKIMLKDFSEVACIGKVRGKLKKK